MVKEPMAVDAATMKAGSDAIKAQRGTQTWGANYVFNGNGLQNDIYTLSDIVAEGGSETTPIDASGLFITSSDEPETVMQITVLADGTITATAV